MFDQTLSEEVTDKKAALQVIHDAVEKFHIAEYEISNLSNDIVDFPIFRVDAKDLKSKLAKTAADHKHRILKSV